MERRERRRALAYEVWRLKQAGDSQRAISRALRISREMVAQLLGEQNKRRNVGESAAQRELAGATRAARKSKLDPYEDRLREWLKTAKRKLSATRCFEMLREAGYDGSYSLVRNKVRELRAEVKPEPPAVEMEYAPGQRAEFDWSPYTLDDDVAVQLWHATLCWSGAPCLEPAQNTKQTTTLRCLRASFEQWGGVPEECLTDSMPGVVDRWECGLPILNVRYIDFALHYGFTALIGGRGQPKAKARGERRFRYHEEDLLGGRKIKTYEQYVELLSWWREHKVMQRDHPRTKRKIAAMLEEERRFLNPLPAHPYDTRDVLPRVVDRYGRVHHETNQYPVPAPVGSLVYVCVEAERLEICDRVARRLIEHERLADGAGVRLEQLPATRWRARYDVDQLVEQLSGWSDIAGEFARRLRQEQRFAGPELVRLLRLQVEWSLDDIVASIQHALDYGCFKSAAIRRILEARHTPRSLEAQIADSTRRHIQQVMQDHPVPQSPPSSLDSLRRGDRAAQEAIDDAE